MTQITINNGVTTITMPKTKKVEDAGSPEYKEVTMASGKHVREVIGYRAGYTYSWDYVPAQTIKDLKAMLSTGGFYTVGYFDIDGTDKSGTFSVSYPTFKVFKFVNGVAMWHNCSLTIKAQEVT